MKKSIQLPLQTGDLIVGFMVWVILSSLLPYILQDIAIPPDRVALVTAVPVILGSVLRVPLGYLTNRLGARTVFLASFACLLLPVWLISEATTYEALITGGVFLGIGGSVFSVGVTSLPKYYPRERHGFVNGVYGFGNMGTALTTWLAPLAAAAWDWRVAVKLYLVLLVAAPHLWHRAEQLLYPRKYEQLVDQWAQTYNLDPLLVDAFIRTESGFDPVATSSVDARGLMQMTEETFLWLRSKIAADEDLAFADLYDPDTSIRFGCYYLHLCLERYNGDVATAAAAYHSGWGTVDNLLRMEEHSADGQTLQGCPYSQMNHYVNKITSCYGAYQRIYAGN